MKGCFFRTGNISHSRSVPTDDPVDAFFFQNATSQRVAEQPLSLKLSQFNYFLRSHFDDISASLEIYIYQYLVITVYLVYGQIYFIL